MKINKKGFTLIELLAVIIILAIIALIAVPTIMNIIENSRKSAAADSAYGLISAGELYYADQLLKNSSYNGGSVNITDLNLKGTAPTGVTTITISADGKVSFTGAVFNGYTCAATDSTLTNGKCTKS